MAGNTDECGPPCDGPGQTQGQGARTDASAGETVEASFPRMIGSDELLRGGTEVIIRHGGEDYRLRRTSKGKLILTK